MFAIRCDKAYNYLIIGLCVFLFWVSTVTAIYQIVKRIMVKKRTKCVHGIAKKLREEKEFMFTWYYIDYQFKINGKSKLLVDGYLREFENDDENDNPELPSTIGELMSLFYGKEIIINDTCNVENEQLWSSTHIGDEIKIKFDPHNPKKYNIPLAEYEFRDSEILWHLPCKVFGSIMTLFLYLASTEILCNISTGNDGEVFVGFIAFFCIYTAGFIVFCSIIGLIRASVCSCKRRSNNDYTQIDGSINDIEMTEKV